MKFSSFLCFISKTTAINKLNNLRDSVFTYILFSSLVKLGKLTEFWRFWFLSGKKISFPADAEEIKNTSAKVCSGKNIFQRGCERKGECCNSCRFYPLAAFSYRSVYNMPWACFVVFWGSWIGKRTKGYTPAFPPFHAPTHALYKASLDGIGMNFELAQ